MLQQNGPGGSGNTRQPLLSKRLAEPPTKRCPPMQHRPLLTHPPTKHSPPMSDSNWPVGTLAAAFGVSEGCGGSHCSMNLQVHSSSPAGGGGGHPLQYEPAGALLITCGGAWSSRACHELRGHASQVPT